MCRVPARGSFAGAKRGRGGGSQGRRGYVGLRENRRSYRKRRMSSRLAWVKCEFITLNTITLHCDSTAGAIRRESVGSGYD
jgi:hypothetical protein